MMDKKIMKDLQKKARTLEPIIRIGKNGLNDNVIGEIQKLIKIRKLIKVKILNSCNDETDDVSKTIVEKTGAELISTIGHSFVLWKR